MLQLPQPLLGATRTMRVGTDKLGLDMRNQAAADVRAIMASIALGEIQEQEGLNNPPTQLVVDGSYTKPIVQVDRRILVTFGLSIAQEVFTRAERALMVAIRRSTTARSGRLGSINNWAWYYNGKPIGGAADVRSFGPGDTLSLIPVHVPHATVANVAVARGGRLGRNVRARRRKGQPAQASRRQTFGFMKAAAIAIQRGPAMRNYRVRVQFAGPGKSYAQGELSKRQGTVFLTIRPRLVGASRRRRR